MLRVVVHSADIQDRDGAALVLDKRTRRLFPFIERIYVDGGYQGLRVRAAAERTLAWVSRNRRLCRDFERYATTVVAYIRLAMIRIMLRRLTKPCPSI